MRLKLIGLIGLLGLIGPMSSANAQDSVRLALHLDGTLFMVDNEYTGCRLDGYTLPGFALRPTVAWRLGGPLTLQGGLHWLHYWGGSGFPPGPLNEVRPTGSDTLVGPHILPWLRARFDFGNNVTLVVGSLNNTDGHGLVCPLYNRERLYAVDPEAGAQLLIEQRLLTADLWVDWRQFIWDRSPMQEIINGGLTLVPRWSSGRWSAELPLAAVVQHRGGEGLTDTTLGHYNLLNATVGLRLGYRIGSMWLKAEGYLLGYARTGHPEGELVYDEWGCLRSEPLDYKRGWGAWTRMAAQWDHGAIEVAYWVSERFRPILGSYHYSNFSSNTSSMTHDRIKVLSVGGHYRWQWTGYDLELQGTLYHYFPFTADRKDYWKCYCPSETMASLGVLVRLHPTIRLIK